MIAGRPSATALLVALGVLRNGRTVGLPSVSHMIAADALRASAGGWRLLGWLAHWRAGRAVLDMVERLLIPGLAVHHCRRKCWLLRQLRSLPTGSQLVWVGVGFDGLGRALCQRNPSLRLVETDHPDTLRIRQSLPAANADDLPHIAQVSCCLPGQADVLVNACARRPCTLVIEGVAMYLRPRPLLGMLRRLAALPVPPRLLFSALAPTRSHGRGFARSSALTRHCLARAGEPFAWRCAPSKLAAILQSVGYQVDACWDGDGFGEFALDAMPTSRTGRGAATAAADL